MLPDDWEKLRKESDRNNGSMSRIFGGGGSIGKRFNLYKADISVDGNKIKSVGIRTKGFIGSLNPERPSLKIKFNDVPGVFYMGMLVCDNGYIFISSIQCLRWRYCPSI